MLAHDGDHRQHCSRGLGNTRPCLPEGPKEVLTPLRTSVSHAHNEEGTDLRVQDCLGLCHQDAPALGQPPQPGLKWPPGGARRLLKSVAQLVWVPPLVSSGGSDCHTSVATAV